MIVGRSGHTQQYKRVHEKDIIILSKYSHICAKLSVTTLIHTCIRHQGPIFVITLYFRRGLTSCTLGLTNDLINAGQPRAKLHLCKATPNHILRTFGQQLYIKSLVNPIVHVRVNPKQGPMFKHTFFRQSNVYSWVNQ